MKELTKSLMCVMMQGGIQLWLEQERVDKLVQHMKGSKDLVKIDDNYVNPFSIIGIYTAQHMEDINRRRNGEWKCTYNNWHGKGHVCECKDREKIDYIFVKCKSCVKVFQILKEKAYHTTCVECGSKLEKI